MKEEKKIGVLGGDRRMLAAARRLAEHGECAVWGLDGDFAQAENVVRCLGWESAVSGSDAVVLPMPAAKDGVKLHAPLSGHDDAPELCEIARRLKMGAVLFGGMLPPLVRAAAAEAGAQSVDYQENETFLILNAAATAEGALAACIRELPVTLSETRAVVTGYGRVGRTLAGMLVKHGAKVAVAARSSRDLGWAEADGCVPIPLSVWRGAPVSCDAVFNTVPARLLDEGALEKLSGAVYFELASAPGGAGREEAEKKGVKYVPLGGLPGQVAPKTAGELIARVVLEKLGEAADG